jgi:hypothetical protein
LINRRKVPELTGLTARIQEHLCVDQIGDGGPCEGLEEGVHLDAVFITLGVGAAAKATEAHLRFVDINLTANFARAMKQTNAFTRGSMTGSASHAVKHCSILTAVDADKTVVPWRNPFTGAPLTTGGGSTVYNQIKGLVSASRK